MSMLTPFANEGLISAVREQLDGQELCIPDLQEVSKRQLEDSMILYDVRYGGEG